MALANPGKNVMLDALAGVALYASVHTADPGTSGASEATGGTPAYARKALTWGSASAGSLAATKVTFDVAAGTYTHFGLWSAATGGTFYGGATLSQSETFAAQGTLDPDGQRHPLMIIRALDAPAVADLLIDPATPAGQQPQGVTGRTLVLSEEFNGSLIDTDAANGVIKCRTDGPEWGWLVPELADVHRTGARRRPHQHRRRRLLPTQPRVPCSGRVEARRSPRQPRLRAALQPRHDPVAAIVHDRRRPASSRPGSTPPPCLPGSGLPHG